MGNKGSASYGLVRDARAPFVGREDEIALLDRALAGVLERGETQVVTLVGATGLGKSRLVQEFVIKHRANAPVPRVYRGQAREADATFAMFGRLLRSRFGLVESMDRDAQKAEVRAQVAKVEGDRKVGDLIYFLGQFLDLPFEESPLTRAVRDAPADSLALRRAVFKAFLEADAQHGATCLVLEDLHRAHDDAIALLRYVVEYLSGPILLLCTARPDFLVRHEDWTRTGERHHRVLDLQTLPDTDAALMLEQLLAPCRETAGRVPQELVDAALSFAGGNPLLLEQMVRIFHDKGVLEEVSVLSDTPAWAVHLDRLGTAQLPITIEDAVDARLAALEPFERRLLEQAATMGSVFWAAGLVATSRLGREPPELWQLDPPGPARTLDELDSQLGAPALGPLDEPGIVELVDQMVERDYLLRMPESTFAGTVEYIFKHNKERETVRTRTPSALLKRYHAIIADWLEHQEVVQGSDESLAILAEHRERSGDRVRAGLAYLDAGAAARRGYAASRACEHFEKGLELLGDGYVLRRIDALHDHGDVLLLTGRIDDALAAFHEMLALAWRLDLRNKGGAAHNRIGRLYRDTGALDEAASHLETAHALFRDVADERGVASSLDDIGKLHWLRGDYQAALGPLREALGKRRRLGDRRSIALSLNNLGLVLQDSGEFRQALEAFEQALGIRRDIGDMVGVVTTLNNLGTIAQDQRDFDRALAMFDEALGVARQIGDRNRISLVLVNIGETHERAGDPQKAIEVLRQAEEQCDELGDRVGLAEALRALGKAYMIKGDLERAREAISRAVDIFAALRSKVHLGGALRTLGEITAAGGWGRAHTKSASEYFNRSMGIFVETGNEVELARTQKAYARFLRAEPEFRGDAAVLAEADRLEADADRVFVRLRVVVDAHPAPVSAPEADDPDETLDQGDLR